MEIELSRVKRENDDTQEDLYEDNVEADGKKRKFGFTRYSH